MLSIRPKYLTKFCNHSVPLMNDSNYFYETDVSPIRSLRKKAGEPLTCLHAQKLGESLRRSNLRTACSKLSLTILSLVTPSGISNGCDPCCHLFWLTSRIVAGSWLFAIERIRGHRKGGRGEEEKVGSPVLESVPDSALLQ